MANGLFAGLTAGVTTQITGRPQAGTLAARRVMAHTGNGLFNGVSRLPTISPLGPGQARPSLPGFGTPVVSSFPFVDVVAGSEPPTSTPSVPGIRDVGVDVFGGRVTVGDVADIVDLFRGGGARQPATGIVAGNVPGTTDCPGITSVRDPITGLCVDLAALPPGGRPAVTGAVQANGRVNGFGPAVMGLYGEGRTPRVEVMTVRRCPPGYALGKDGVCYRGLGRNSPRRAWPMGQKPLLTGGDRAAIRRATSAAKKLKRAKSDLAKAGRALDSAAGRRPARGGSRGVITKSEAARALRK